MRKLLQISLASVILNITPLLADIPANIGYYLPGIAVGKNSSGGVIYGLDVCANAGMHTYLLWDGADGIQAYFCGVPGLVDKVPATLAPQAHQMPSCPGPSCPTCNSVLYEFQYTSINYPSATKSSDLFKGAFAQACVPTPKCGQSDPTYCVSGKWVTANSANCPNGCCTDSNANILYCQSLPPIVDTSTSDPNACSTIDNFLTTKLGLVFDPTNPSEALAGLPQLLAIFGRTSSDLLTFQGQTAYQGAPFTRSNGQVIPAGTSYYNGNLIPELKLALQALISYYYDFDTFENSINGVSDENGNINRFALSANYLNQLPTYLTQVWNPAAKSWAPNTQTTITNPLECNYSAAVSSGGSALQASATNDAIGQLTARW
ncbi:MAG TPA: hypothetical protein VJJ83_03655, partial [Candidatus Babeliales bacterium]|nr:hypothetical protein [Candidatus Babeliales bacterium]